MGPEIEVCALGAATLDENTNETLWQASQSPDDRRQIPEAAVIQSLGVSSQPYGPSDDKTEFCEGLLLTQAGGYMGIVFAARDARSTKAIGRLAPGDTCLHSTGPKSHAKVLLKEKTSTSALLSKDKDEHDIGVIVDGETETITITGFKNVIQMSRKHGIVMSSPNGQHGITITDSGVHIRGSVVLGGMVPAPGMALMMGPVTGQSPASGVAVLSPALGVTVGT